MKQHFIANIGQDGVLTLCDAFINQYFYDQGKQDNLNVKVFKDPCRNISLKKVLVIHVEPSILNKREDTNGRSCEVMSVIIRKSGVNQWQRLGVTFGHICPIFYDDHPFMLGYGKDEKLLLESSFHCFICLFFVLTVLGGRVDQLLGLVHTFSSFFNNSIKCG